MIVVLVQNPGIMWEKGVLLQRHCILRLPRTKIVHRI